MRKKGEVRKLGFRPLTLDDTLTKEGLEAVSTLTDKEPYYLVGGMAAQSYLPTVCRRPTSDIDLSVVKPLNYDDFKHFSKPVVEYFSDNGYAVQHRKHSRAFNLDIENEEGERLLIEFSRRNKKSFEKSRRKLERELEHSKRKIVEGKKSTYVVAAPEDIVVPKLARSVNSLQRNPKLKNVLPKESSGLSEEYIKRRIDFINQIREEAMLSPGDLELAERLRFVSDVYDIRILSEIAGVNIDYFYKAAEDWTALSEETPESKVLFGFILPQLES